MPIHPTPISCIACAERGLMEGDDLPLDWVQVTIKRLVKVQKTITNPENPEESMTLEGIGAQEHTDVLCPKHANLVQVRLSFPEWEEIEIDDDLEEDE